MHAGKVGISGPNYTCSRPDEMPCAYIIMEEEWQTGERREEREIEIDI